MNAAFTARQKRTLFACFLLYTVAYFNRLNLSAALYGVIETLGISAAQAGLLQTIFAVAYAAGQFVNGALSDRFNPTRHMLIGLFGSAVCNLCIGLSSFYPLTLALCLCNGAFQSMLWTPILRLLSLHFSGKKERESANFLVSLTLVAGHFGAWAISGFLASAVSWRFSFIVPSIIAVPALFAVSALLKGEQNERRRIADSSAPAKAPAPAFPVFAATGFFLVLASCMLYGFVRDGIITWAPEILRTLGGGDSLSSASFSLIIPVINCFGVLLGYLYLRRSKQNNRRLVAMMLSIAALCCLPLRFLNGMLPAALLMGGACACLYGLNTILTALVPLEYDEYGRIGLAAGMIDSFIYVGSALAGALAGGIFDALGVDALYFAWFIVSLAAAALSWLSGCKKICRSSGR